MSAARVLIEDSGKLNMNCRCGAQMPVRDTGKPGVGVTRCRECRAVYDYSCWEIRRTPDAVYHMVEAFVREPTHPHGGYAHMGCKCRGCAS